MALNSLAKFATILAASFAAGAIGSLATAPGIQSRWYLVLEKPPLDPPGWLFSPVWIALYATMGFAAFLVWREGWERREVRKAIGVFALQLALNALWPVLFFALEAPLAAFFEILVLWAVVLWTIRMFRVVSRAAAWLLAPYLAWLTFAAYLNAAIWLIN